MGKFGLAMLGATVVAVAWFVPILGWFFALGVTAGWLKSDLAIPEAISKGLSLYLMLAIGFKGGVELASNSVAGTIAVALALALALSFSLPVLAYALLRIATRLTGVRSRMVTFDYELTRLSESGEEGERLASASTTLVSLDAEGRPASLPTAIRELLNGGLSSETV